MNWGLRIAVLYVGFMALILTLVFTCFGQKTELESKDYYSKELNFQRQIDATNNTAHLSKPIEHRINGRTVEIGFPSELLAKDFNGTVNFIRPSDSSKDKLFKLVPNAEGKQILKDASFIKGVYKMQLSFISNGKSYFEEDIVYLN